MFISFIQCNLLEKLRCELCCFKLTDCHKLKMEYIQFIHDGVSFVVVIVQ